MAAKTGNSQHMNSSSTLAENCEYSDREKDLMNRCIRLIQGRGKENPPVIREVTSPSDEGCTDMSSSMISSIVSAGSIE